MVEDIELLRSYSERQSEAAFTELVTRRIGLVYSIALRQTFGDIHLAQDVTQRVFVALARKASGLKRRETIVGWLYQVTHFISVDAVRNEQRRRERETKAQGSAEPATDQLESEQSFERVRPMLDEAIACLAVQDRNAILLRFYDGKSFAEVGRELRLSEDAARMRVNRVLDKLRKRLQQFGTAPGAATLGSLIASQEGVGAPAALNAAVSAAALNASSAGILSLPLKIMSIAKIGTIAATVAGLAALGTIGFEYVSWRRVESDYAQQDRSNQASLLELGALEKQVQITDAEVREIDGRLAMVRKQAAEESASAASGERKARDDRGRELLDAHPEVKAAFRNWKKAIVDSLYDPLFRKLGLGPDQIASFETILLQHSGGGQMMTANGPATITPVEQLPGTADGDLRTLLGPEGFAAFQDYAVSMGARQTVQGIAVSAYSTGSPITCEQASQLLGIIGESTLNQEGGSGSSQIDWANVTAKAAGLLDPAQAAVLSQLVTSAKADALIRQAQAEVSNSAKER
jgi:RNA polymerase sigma factor (sigma-70 family)